MMLCQLQIGLWSAHLEAGSMTLDTRRQLLGTVGEAQRGERLFAIPKGGVHASQDAGLGIPAERLALNDSTHTPTTHETAS